MYQKNKKYQLDQIKKYKINLFCSRVNWEERLSDREEYSFNLYCMNCLDIMEHNRCGEGYFCKKCLSIN